MGKVKKQKRHLKFRYSKDRRKGRKKAKEVPNIQCAEIKKAWDVSKSMSQNLFDMGVSKDSNKTIKIPLSKNMRRKKLDNVMEVDVEKIEKTPTKTFVVEELERLSQIPGKKKMSMSDEDAGFCVHMMDKYGENYKAMARDSRNYYQETPKQIQRKINRFKSIPEMYNIYAEARQGQTHAVDESIPTTGVLSSVSMPPNRCPTRLYDACRRNGHFVSPESSVSSSLAVFVPQAALCRVRRRLHFGRKAPKDRSAGSEENVEGNATGSLGLVGI